MKKYFLLLTILFLASGFMTAQDFYEMPDYYGLNNDKPKKTSASVELGIGHEFEMGVLFKRNFNKYISWDILHVKYALDYTDDHYWVVTEDHPSYYNGYSANNLHELSFTTGIRAYAPKLGKVKFFGACDLGWACDFMKYYNGYYNGYEYDTERTMFDYFALDFTLGAYIGNHVYLGYGLGFQTYFDDDDKHTDHQLRVGYEF